MDNWERFNEILLTNKEDFYSSLNMEAITDVDYRRAGKVFKEFKMNNLGDYQDFYVQSYTILLSVVFENFRDNALTYISLILFIFYQHLD